MKNDLQTVVNVRLEGRVLSKLCRDRYCPSKIAQTVYLCGASQHDCSPAPSGLAWVLGEFVAPTLKEIWWFGVKSREKCIEYALGIIAGELCL